MDKEIKKKRIKAILVLLAFSFWALILLILSLKKVEITMCPLFLVTGRYCCFCGGSRCIGSLLHFDFYAAFCYNQLVIIFLPYAVYVALAYFVNNIIGKKIIPFKFPSSKTTYIILAIFLIYGILRNIPFFSVLAPHKIR